MSGHRIYVSRTEGLSPCANLQTWLKMLVSHVTTASPPFFNSSAVMVHMPDARAFFN